MSSKRAVRRRHQGARGRNRTRDIFITSEVLYQLSYSGAAPQVTGLRPAHRSDQRKGLLRAGCRGRLDPQWMTTSRTTASSGSLSIVRAAAVLILFVVAVAVLVSVGTRPSVSSTPTTTPTTASTARAPRPTTSRGRRARLDHHDGGGAHDHDQGRAQGVDDHHDGGPERDHGRRGQRHRRERAWPPTTRR